MEDWESEFTDLVAEIDMDDLTDPRSPEVLSPWEVHRAVLILNETAAYLSEYLLARFTEKDLTIPGEISPVIRDLVQKASYISSCITTDYSIQPCQQCDETTLCESCYNEMEI